MTVLEFLRSASAEEIANAISEENSTVGAAFDINTNCCYFDMASECPEECDNLVTGEEYETALYNGMCLNDHHDCPYHVDRTETVKKQVMEWLSEDCGVK